jgi:type IV secretion system protein VirB10
VLARVSQPVKDVTFTETLIPAGALLHGWQDSRNQVLQNDHSILVRWDQIEYPNGGTVNLPQMPAMDPEGLAGIDGDVNHHYAQVWGPALLISAITAGVSLASHPTYGGYQGYSPEQQAFGSGAQVLGGRAIGQLGSDMNMRPTITVPAGSTFRVLVTRNLTFDAPYQGEAQ